MVLLAMIAGCSFTPGQLAGDGGSSSDDANTDVGGGDSDPGVDAASDAPPDGTLREKPITIGMLALGAHADFPLWVKLDDQDIAARARPDGQDIHFVDAAGQPLDYEIQRWSGGVLEAWVRVPMLAANTQLAVRYGDLAAAHAQNPAGVFGSFLAVWHLEDPLTQSTIVEARGVATGTAMDLQPNDQVVAQLGGGIDFDGGNDQQITFTNPLTGSGSHTISLWVNQRATASNDALVVLGNGMDNQARWFHSRFNQATIAVGFYDNDWADPDHDIQGDGWVLLHWVFRSGNRESTLYRNGTPVAGPFKHGPGINTAGTQGVLGNAPGAFGQNMGVLATLDEVRIAGTARSNQWIATEAINQVSPAQFYSVGAERIP